MKKEELANYFRESVAGAARALWFECPTPATRAIIEAKGPAQIVYIQAMQAMGLVWGEFGMTPMAYAVFANARRHCADAAEQLVMRRGASSGWLRAVARSKIIDAAESVINVDASRARRVPIVLAEGPLQGHLCTERTYTLEDLRKAYRAGHLNTWASGDGPGVDSQEWTQERDEALARI